MPSCPVSLDVYSRFRHQKVVTCPDTRGLAEVKLSARWAALTAIFRKSGHTRKELYLMAKKEGVRGRLCARKLAAGVKGTTMNDMTKIIATLVFASIWYAMTLIGRALFRPYEKLRLVWCPEVRRMSFVETVATSKGKACRNSGEALPSMAGS